MNSGYAFDQVMSRLKSVCAAGSDGQLAEELGLSGSAYANLKKRGSIPYEKVIALAMSYKVNLNWLFTGDNAEPTKQSLSTLSPTLDELQPENLITLLTGLTERQVTTLKRTIEDYHDMNRLINQVEALSGRAKQTT
jgi:hypothetical protein